MKHTFKILCSFVGFLCAHSAQAAWVDLVQVHADYFPNNAYSIGLDLGDPLQMNQIYFDQNGEKTFFPLSLLGDFQPIMTVSGSTVVQMRVVNQSRTLPVVIELLYTKNVITGSQDQMSVSINFNETTGQYFVTDLRDNRVIHSAAAHTHYTFPHIATGIDSIETE